MQEPIIKLQDVSVVYNPGEDNEVVAVHNIDFEIYPGEYIVFFGQSGSGKSTLLYTIAGLESASKGSVTVAGHELRSMREEDMIKYHRTTIGMVFQAFYLVPHYSVLDNIGLPFMFVEATKDQREAKARELVERFGLKDIMLRKPSEMSGGQQQRTAIARALMHDPQIILADEPVGNLDTKNAEIVLDLLAKINIEEKRTIIQVTHNPKDISYADRVVYLKDGMIEKIVKNPKKRGVAGGEASELDQLAIAHPELAEHALWAKLVTRHLLHPFDMATEEKIEGIATRFIGGEIKESELARILDAREGAGLQLQTARKLAGDIVRIVGEMKAVYADTHTPAKTAHPKSVESIRTHLLAKHHSDLSRGQVQRLDLLIEECLGGLAMRECYRRLDAPQKKGGIGLDSRSARRFVQEMALILGIENV